MRRHSTKSIHVVMEASHWSTIMA